MYVDWSERGAYIFRKHGIGASVADEAVADEDAVWLDPDPRSTSGRSIRVIGFSIGARQIVTVILLRQGAREKYWGVNAWVSNARDRKTYQEMSR